MCAVDACDGYNEFMHTEERRAAKDHRCTECNRTIAKGERYLVSTWKYDGHLGRDRMCAHCNEVTRWLRAVCGGVVLAAVEEDLIEHVGRGEEAWLVGELHVFRIAWWMGRDWQWRGELMSVERVRDEVDKAIAVYRARRDRVAA